METPEQIMKKYQTAAKVKAKAKPVTTDLNPNQFWIFIGKVMGLASALALTLLILLLAVFGVLWTAKQIIIL